MVAEMHEQTDTADLQVGTGQPITKRSSAGAR